MASDKNWVLNKDQGSEFRVVIAYVVVAFQGLLNECVTSRDRNVICHPHIAVCTATNSNFLTFCEAAEILTVLHWFKILSINYVEAFGIFVRERLENYEITAGALHFNDVDDLVVPRHFVGESDLAEFAVHFLELHYYVIPVHFSCTLRLQPASQALQVNVADGARAFAGRDKWIDVCRVELLFIFIFSTQAYPTDILFTTLGS